VHLLAIIATGLLVAPPSCVVTVGQLQANGRGQVSVAGFAGRAQSAHHYSLGAAAGRITGGTADRPALLSLTWRPPDADAATMTCTQRMATARPPGNRAPIVMCAVDDEYLVFGRRAATWTHGEQVWRAAASGFELRISASDGALGFAAIWREASMPGANAATLDVGAHRATCWVYPEVAERDAE